MPIVVSLTKSALAAGALAVALTFMSSVAANSAPFSNLPGRWSGTGKIRVQGQDPERLRCNADYQPRGSSAIVLHLACDSDSYKFNLTGNFEADSDNSISGRWTESTRNIGGTAVGRVTGDRFELHVESSAFAATLRMVTRSSRQSVTFGAQGGGQIVDASITLSKGR